MLKRTAFRSVKAQTIHYLSRPHSRIPRGAVGGPAAWRAKDIAQMGEGAWSYDLSDSAVEAIERQLATTDTTVPLEQRHAEALPLTMLQDLIDEWRFQLTHGRGFIRIRGVPVARWSMEDVERFYWSLGQHLGVPGAQNSEGHLLGHVLDLREPGRIQRQYKTSEAIAYHCDTADAVGLLCVKTAKEGGISRIASSVAIHDRILSESPNLAAALFSPLYCDTRGDGGVDVFRVQPSCYDRSRLRTFYHSGYFRSAPNYAGVPALSDNQLALLDRFDALAESPEFAIEMVLEPGDIQLISNHSVVHSRTHYIDHDALEERRHLLRLWLSIETSSSPHEQLRRARSALGVVEGLVRRKLGLTLR